MEICSLHHAESQGFEMRVGSLLDTLPEYKNLRKTHSQSPSLTQGPLEMKRTHSEMDAAFKKGPPQPTCLSTKISQKFKAHAQSACTTQVMRTESEFQSTCNSSSKVTDCKIFLGGSCNPTSWRKDIAIPILTHSGISFFNPQVASWCPELMAAEHEAKDLANFLFFVIDSETRAVASLVEVAYLIAQGKNVILVLTGLPRPGNIICGEPITELEIQDLACAQNLLRQLSTRNNIRIFECIRTAVQTTAKLCQNEGEQVSKSENGHGFSCRLALSTLETPATTAEILPKEASTRLDVFMGGSSLTEEALGHLKKNGLCSWTHNASEQSSLLDDPRINETKILFFYLSNSFRALESMILAAYYVGLSKNVVLCIENLDDGCVVGNEVLSKTAIKDYNRGRSYLRDVADRHGVPICSTLAEALDTILKKLGPCDLRS